MKDVSALLGKLKSKVGYQQFGDEAGDDLTQWPVLRQAAVARDQAAAAAGDAPAQPPAAEASTTAPAATPAGPTRAASAQLLRRYAGPESSLQDGRPALADIFAKLERKTR